MADGIVIRTIRFYRWQGLSVNPANRVAGKNAHDQIHSKPIVIRSFAVAVIMVTSLGLGEGLCLIGS
jgi:hypothetical protein